MTFVGDRWPCGPDRCRRAACATRAPGAEPKDRRTARPILSCGNASLARLSECTQGNPPAASIVVRSGAWIEEEPMALSKPLVAAFIALATLAGCATTSR